MTSRKIPESAVENLVSDLEGKVDKTSTQTISGSKRFTQPVEGMSIELTADTNQQIVPATAGLRQLGLYRNATYTKGDGYSSWLQGVRGSDGWSATEIYTRRFLESDSQEIVNYLRVNVTPEGVPISYTKTPPAFCGGDEIVTAGWVRNACLLPGEIIIWSTSTPPEGYLICNGAAISRTTYAALFHVIGTTWGAGDGNTTFNIPNLTFGNYISNPTVYGTGAVMRVGANTAASVRNVFITSARAQGNILMAIDGGETSGNCFWAPEALGLYAKTDNVKTAKLCIKY